MFWPPLNMCKVIRSDKFAYRKKRNVTLHGLQKHFVKAMTACSQPRDHGFSLHLCVSKADWKFRREWLSQERHWSNINKMGAGQLCPRCLAGSEGRPWVDLAERFNNPADLQAAEPTSAGHAVVLLFRCKVFYVLCILTPELQRLLHPALSEASVHRYRCYAFIQDLFDFIS